MNDIKWAVIVACILSLAFTPAFLQAENPQLTNVDLVNVIHAKTIAASGTLTSGVTAGTKSFKPLRKTVFQSGQVQGTGTSPNYKVELLVSLDGVNFVKPEVGGDVGTFTDQNLHIFAIGVPLSVEHQFKVTELGGANSITIEASELSL